MTTDIRFKSGQPIEMVATRTFTLGGANMTFRKGQEIEFDGSMATVDGETMSLPQLRGAVKQGWVVPIGEYDENAVQVRPSANIQVRHPTKGGNPMSPPDRAPIVSVEADERIVGNTTQAAAAAQANNRAYHSNREASRTQLPPGVEAQDGVAVRTLKTPAKSRGELTAENAGTLIRQAAAPTIEPIKGASEEDLLARMTEQEREEYLAKKDSKRAQYEDDVQRAAAAHGTGRKTVAKVAAKKPVVREGVTVGVTVGGGIETEDVSDPTAKQRVEVVEREGIRFTTTNVAKDKEQAHPRAAADRPAGFDPRRMVARTLCPDFPDSYSFDVPAKRRLGRLQADYADRPDVIRAAFAAESDEVKALIVAEFPEAFTTN